MAQALMVVLVPYMILAIFYVGRATIKLIVAMVAILAVIFSLTVKAINMMTSTTKKQ